MHGLPRAFRERAPLSPGLLVWRSLLHRPLLNAATVLVLAVACATLVGALNSGRAVERALERRALERLGSVHQLVDPGRSFPQDLAAEGGDALPFLALRGVAENDAGQTAPVLVLGLPPGFPARFCGAPVVLMGREALIAPALAQELGLAAGAGFALRLPRLDQPGGTIFVHRRLEPATVSARLGVGGLAPPTLAAFAPGESGSIPPAVVLDLASLQSLLDAPGRVNRLAAGPGDLSAALAAADPRARGLETDAGQVLRAPDLLIDRRRAAAARRAAASCGVELRASSVQLAERLGHGRRSAWYVIVAAGDPAPDLPLVRGSAQLGPESLLLSTWLAEDLEAAPGDRLRLAWRPPQGGPIEERELTVSGILADRPPAADPSLVPVLPGITDADSIERWETPFPIDRSRIGTRDEAWWEAHRTAPKAWIAPASMQRIWGDADPAAGPGWITGLHGLDGDAGVLRCFAAALARELPPAACGLAARPVRAEALAAARVGGEQTGILLGLGSVLAFAALAIAALLLRHGLRQRSREWGILLVLGWSPGLLRRVIVMEFLVLAGAGSLLGGGLGLVWSWILLAGLARPWSGALGGLPLAFAVETGPMLLGLGAGFLACLATALTSERGILRRRPEELIRDQVVPVPPPGGSVPSLAWIGLALGSLTVLLAGISLLPPLVAGALGAGAILLVGFAVCARLLAGPPPGSEPGLMLLVRRHAGADRLRSFAVLGCAAAAALMMSAAGLHRDGAAPRHPEDLWVSLALPLRLDLDDPGDRRRLGCRPEEGDLLARCQVATFLQREGDPLGCEDPTRPGIPRILGAGAAAWRLLRLPPLETRDGALGETEAVEWRLRLAPGDHLRGPGDRPLRLAGLHHEAVLGDALLLREDVFRAHYPEEDAPRRLLVRPPPEQAASVAVLLRRILSPWGVQIRSAGEVVAAAGSARRAWVDAFLVLGGSGVLLGSGGLAALALRTAFERRQERFLLNLLGWTPSACDRLLVAEQAGLAALGLGLGLLAGVCLGLPAWASGSIGASWWLIPPAFIFILVLAGFAAWGGARLGAQGRLSS